MTGSRKISILVVDDEGAARWGLARLLARDGYEADQAPDGKKALEILSLREYDIIITDIRMPAMSGVDFIKAIKEIYHGRIIVMTAHGTAETFYQALDFGAFEYINKPIDYDNLLQIIREITKGRG